MADKMQDVTVALGYTDESPLHLIIESRDGRTFEPPVKDGIKITWERVGVPGKLEFTTVKATNENMSFWEGDRVTFTYKEKTMFVGYVFSKKRNKDHHIKVTAYDQTRYLKNKFSYVFEETEAEKILESLCYDFQLQVGEFAETGYKVPAIAEENTTAFDIILKVNEEVLSGTSDLYVFYDDAGKLYYKNALDMKLDILISEFTAEDFDYESSIDDQTYNSVVLYYKPGAQQVAANSAGTAGSTSGTIVNDATYLWPSMTTYITYAFGLPTGYGPHLGCDIGAASGTPIYASKSGKAVTSGHHGSYGNCVQLFHADGSYTRYAHMSSIAIGNGAIVNQGDVIGYCGSTGTSTGPHIHFELSLDGYSVVNPEIYVSKANLPNAGITKMAAKAPKLVSNNISTLASFETSGYEEQIWAAIRTKGFSAAATAGIMGNMYQESRMRPTSASYDGGYGLCQWTGVRNTNLKNWCSANGYDYTTVNGQINFMNYEYNTYYGARMGDFKNSTSPSNAADTWLQVYEGIWDGTHQIRRDAANHYYNLYSGNEPTTSDATTQSTGSDIQIFHEQDEEHIKEWGLLRYFEEVKSPSIGAGKAKELLKLYNRKTRSLKIKGAFGDPYVRAGCLIPTVLNLGDLVTNNYFIVEKVVHTFERDRHYMDLDLDGAWED